MDPKAPPAASAPLPARVGVSRVPPMDYRDKPCVGDNPR
jgi:hypothetical protein